jgi:3-oxoacyl-[acyl-carrier protein] reductase
MTSNEWGMLKTKSAGCVPLCQGGAALKAANGAIVKIASIAGLGRAGSSLAYSATNAGVAAIDRTHAAEAALPAGGSGRGDRVPGIWCGD